MKLIELTIELQRWGDNVGTYKCAVKYEGEHGGANLILDPEISNRLLAFLGPAVTACTHKTSLKLEEALQQSLREVKKLPELEAVQVQ